MTEGIKMALFIVAVGVAAGVISAIQRVVSNWLFSKLSMRGGREWVIMELNKDMRPTVERILVKVLDEAQAISNEKIGLAETQTKE